LDWRPQYSGLDQLAGCVWLARLLDKARRAEDPHSNGLGDYLFGEGDYLDAKVLRFLGVSGLDVRSVVRSEPNDEIAARTIVTKSGKTPAECEAFNTAFVRRNGLFLAMIQADEDRRPLSLKSKIMKDAYNLTIVPMGKIMYRLHRARES
jgi:hypothetical protein